MSGSGCGRPVSQYVKEMAASSHERVGYVPTMVMTQESVLANFRELTHLRAQRDELQRRCGELLERARRAERKLAEETREG